MTYRVINQFQISYYFISSILSLMRRYAILIILVLLSSIGLCQTNSRHVHVKGHYRSDGTYVQPHYRTAPNSTNRDNFSTRPNINPYTGKPGYIEPDNNGYDYNYSNGNTNRNTYKNSNTSQSERIYLDDESGQSKWYLVRFDANNILRKYKIYNTDDEYCGYMVVFSDDSYHLYNAAGNFVSSSKQASIR